MQDAGQCGDSADIEKALEHGPVKSTVRYDGTQSKLSPRVSVPPNAQNSHGRGRRPIRADTDGPRTTEFIWEA